MNQQFYTQPTISNISAVRDKFKRIPACFLAAFFFLFSFSAAANTYTVSNLSNAGAGSLRQAILNANAGGVGPHAIVFTVSGTIVISSVLPTLTVAVKIDPVADGQTIIISASPTGANVTYGIFVLGTGAGGTALKNMTLQNTGTTAINITATHSNDTLQNLILRQTGATPYFNTAFYCSGVSTNMLIQNVVISGVESINYQAFRFTTTVTGLKMIGDTVRGGGTGGPGYAVLISGAATNVSIAGCYFDANGNSSTDDGQYGVYFVGTTSNVKLSNCTLKDFEVYGLCYAGAATRDTLENCVFTNMNGYQTAQHCRFNGTTYGILVSGCTFDGDKVGTTDDGDYGLLFLSNGVNKNITITNNTFNEYDINGMHMYMADTDSMFISGNTFTKNGNGTNFTGGLRFIYMRNTTSDLGPVRVWNNTFSYNNGDAIHFSGTNTTASYIIPNFRIDHNTISNTKSSLGAIRVDYIDKIIIDSNSIYNNVGRGIELAGGGNCSYENTLRPTIVSSTPTGVNTYDVVVNLPSICSGGCRVDLYATDAGYKNVGGQYLISTFTGQLNGNHTYSVTSTTPPVVGTPYGLWTATLRLPANNCGTSEFSEKKAIRPNGPAGVSTDVRLWLRGDELYNAALDVPDADGQTMSFWEEFSGGGAPSGAPSAGTVTNKLGGINFNPTASMTGGIMRGVGATYMTNDSFTTVAVFRTTANAAGSRVFTYYDSQNADDGAASTSSLEFYNPTGAINTYRGGTLLNPQYTTAATFGTPGLFASVTTANTHSGYYNGKNMGIHTGLAKGALNAEQWFIGGGYNSGWVGTSREDFAEVVGYNRTLTAAELQKVNSYFALKYGITIDQTTATDYQASTGVALWTAASNGIYKNDIAGLSRDNASVLHQKISRSVNSDDVVRFAVGAMTDTLNANIEDSVINNLSALMWANDNGSTSFGTTFSTAYSDTRMTRVWKADKTNWADEMITVQLKGTGISPTNKYLIISNTDPTFAVVDQYYALDVTGKISFNSSALPDGAYFTFANKVVGPACITTNIQAWYRADDGSSDGSNWNDFSGKDVPATQATPANQPAFINRGINYQPVFDFDGTNSYMDIASSLGIGSTATDFTMIGLGMRQSVGTHDAFISQQGSITNNLSFYYANTNKISVTKTGVYAIAGTGTYGTANIPQIAGLTRSGSTFSLYADGAADGTGSNATGFTAANMRMGNRAASADLAFNGYIGELVVYNRALSATELQTVSSYLALKYGITMSGGTQNYLASDGSKMWDAAVNAAYKNNIAGLGKDTCGSLHTKQGRSITDTTFAMAMGDFVDTTNAANTNNVINNISFLTWGNNNLATTFATAVSGTNATVRMARVWKVDKTNWADTNIVIDYSGNATNGYLLISNTDPTFATIDQEIAMNPDGTVPINSSLLPDGAYFTFARQIIGPNYTNVGIAAWFRADDNNTSDSTWLDFSGKANDVLQPAAGIRPVYTAGNVINYLPSMKFSAGVNDFLSPAADILGNGNIAYTIFGVGNGVGGNIYSEGTNATDNGLYARNTSPTASHDFPSRSFTLAGIPTTSRFMRFGYSALSAAPNNTRTMVLNGGNASGTGAVFALNKTGVGTGQIGVGINNTTTDDYDGNLSEVIIYNKLLDAGQMQKVESYLALKYGITLNSGNTDYLNTDSTIIWNSVTNTGFHSRVTGIGRDDKTALNQKQSRNVDTTTTGYVAMALVNLEVDNATNTNTFSDDSTFLFWADDNVAGVGSASVIGDGTVTLSNGSSCLVERRLGKTFRVSEVGEAGIVQVVVNLKGVSLAASAADLYLAINTTNSFSGVITRLVKATSFVNGVAVFDGVDFSDGQFFTVIGEKASAPANVLSGRVKLWLQADNGISDAGAGTASQWDDQGLAGNNATQVIAANQPIIPTTPVFNFNPGLLFDGTNSYLDINNTLGIGAAATSFTAIGVGKRAGVGTSDVFFGAQGNPVNGFGFGYSTTNKINIYRGATSVPGTASYNTANIPQIATATRSATFVNSIYANGVADGTPVNVSGFTATNMRIGNRAATAGDAFNGYIGEVIMYDTILNAGNLNKIYSYLGIKYGITHGGGDSAYRASDSTVIWTPSAAYKYRITGIGRDDCSGLLQNQSSNQDTTSPGYVTIALDALAPDNLTNTGIFPADKSYLLWADDNVPGIAASAVIADATGFTIPGVSACVPVRRLSKTFMVQQTGTVNPLEISFNLSGLNMGLAADIYLAINNSSTFGAVVTLLVPATSLTNGIAKFNNVSFTSGQFFTIIGKKVEVPATVSGNLMTWVKADDGIVFNGALVTEWDEQSLNTNNALAPVGSEPAFNSNGLNFNPSLDFASSYMDFSNVNINSATNPNITAYVVYKPDVNTLTRTLWGNGTTTTSRFLCQTQYSNNPVTAYTGGNIAGRGLMLGTQYNLATANASFIRVNGLQAANFTQTVANSGTTFLRIGESTAATNPFDGNMAEFILYNRNLTDPEKQRIESYLAVKWGISKDSDYVASDGSVTWTANATYKNAITGIGIDRCSDMLQKQSTNQSGQGVQTTIGLGTIVATNLLNTGSFAADKSFLIWGHDSASFTTTVPAQVAGVWAGDALARTWKYQNTNNVGAVQVMVDLNLATPATSTTASDYALLIDNNNDGIYDVAVIATSIAGNVATFDNVIFGGSTGLFKIGVLEKVITVQTKIFLQGSYSGGATMYNKLRANNLVPLSQPYSSGTYSGTNKEYPGTETIDALPANAVDWVYVEVRSGTAGATKVSARAGILLNDGTIVDTTAGFVTPLTIKGALAGNYYIVIRHRNHLGIMSALPVALNGSSALYDFTTAQTQAYGTTPMVALSGGQFALRGGNANYNADVRFNGPLNDQNEVLTIKLGGLSTLILTGQYDNSDLNMDGVIKWNGPGNDQNFLLNIVLGGSTVLILTDQVPL